MPGSTASEAVYLSPRQAASAAALSVKTLRRAIKAGHLVAYRIGRQLRIPRAAFVAFVEKRRV